MATTGCVLFSYCNITRVCEVWHSDKTEIGWSDVFNHQCLSREPATSSRRWYVAGATPNVTTVTCKEIKEQNPSASDGYYKIKVRGIETEAYCVMSEVEDGLTFIDVQDAYTEFNNGPNDPATMRYSKIRLQVDNCVMRVPTYEWRFTQQTLHYSGQPHDYITIRNGVLRGSGCETRPVRRNLDIRGSIFSFILNNFEYGTLDNGVYSPIANANKSPQRIFTEYVPGNGKCVRTANFFIEGDVMRETDYIPLQIYRP
ncbi:uncharacterized protein LOC142342024 [Convolutriloba macropyga]|uniref:uncharacterized protein LOC142342024 n=1 Tax=Convolutriloba macropyga TaxID=536237 RepID=UPI003F52638E